MQRLLCLVHCESPEGTYLCWVQRYLEHATPCFSGTSKRVGPTCANTLPPSKNPLGCRATATLLLFLESRYIYASTPAEEDLLPPGRRIVGLVAGPPRHDSPGMTDRAGAAIASLCADTVPEKTVAHPTHRHTHPKVH